MISNNINYTITLGFCTVLIILFLIYKKDLSVYSKHYYHILDQINSLIIVNSINFSMPIILIVLGYLYGIKILYCIIIPDIIGHLLIANVLIPYFYKRDIQYETAYNSYVDKMYNLAFCVYRLLIILNFVYVYKILFYTFNDIEIQIVNLILLCIILYFRTFLLNKYHNVIKTIYKLILFSLIFITYCLYVINFNNISIIRCSISIFDSHKEILSTITFTTLFLRFILINFSKRIHNIIHYAHPYDISLLRNNYNIEIIKMLFMYLTSLFLGVILYSINNSISPLHVLNYVINNYTQKIVGFIIVEIFYIGFFISYFNTIENFFFKIKKINHDFYVIFLIPIVTYFISAFNSESCIFVKNYTAGLLCYYIFLPILFSKLRYNIKIKGISFNFFISTNILIILLMWFDFKYVSLIISLLSLLIYFLL